MEAWFVHPISKIIRSPFKSFQDYQKWAQYHQGGLGLELLGLRVVEAEGAQP